MNLDASLTERSATIFINYRREDSAGHAGRLFDRLSPRFPSQVFMDIDTLEPGVDFFEVIEQKVSSCDVMIVLIGQNWLAVKDAGGRRRLEDSADFVRLEVAAALRRKIRVIPVLVQGATMPRAEELPPDLAILARRNAIELSDARWAFDADRLVRTIVEILPKPKVDLSAPAAVTTDHQETAGSGLATSGGTPELRAGSDPLPADSKSARIVLILGILGLIGSFFLCGVTSPIAWYLGNREARAIREGRLTPAGEASVRTGRVLGIIGTVIWVAYLLVLVLYMVLHKTATR